MTKLGDGSRFKRTERALAKKGAKNPAALAAWLGRKRYGNDRFAALSAAGRERGMADKLALRRVKL